MNRTRNFMRTVGKMLVFIVRDRVSESNNLPFFANTLNHGIRMFRDVIMSRKVRPEEYQLLCIGVWDETDCTLEAWTPEDVYVDFPDPQVGADVDA